MLGYKRGEGGDGDDSWQKELVKLARDAVPVVGPMIAQHLAGAAAPNAPRLAGPSVVAPGSVTGAAAPLAAGSAPAAPAVPAGFGGEAVTEMDAGAARTGATEASQPETEEEAMLRMALNRFRVAALQAARTNKDAYAWTCSMLDFIPVDYHLKIFELAKSADWFAQIFQGDPEAQRHTKWLNEMREAVFARALVATAAGMKAVNKSAEETARHFTGWLPVDALDTIYQWAEPEDWKLLFEGATTLAADAITPIPFDEVWLEALRVELDKILDPSTAKAAKAK
jgi:hypothetical protein